MKIAHVTPFFYPEIGGMETAVLNQCRELVKLKNEVHVFTCDRYRNETKIYNKTAEIYGIKIHYLRSLLHIEKSHVFPSIFTEIDGTFDIVHTHAMHHYHNDLAALSSRIRHRKTVFTSHLDLKDETKQSSFFPKLVVPTYKYYLFKVYDATARLSMFRNVNRIIALTKYDEVELIKRGVDPRKIRIIPNGVQRVFFEKPDADFKDRYKIDGRVVLYAGRLHKEKHIDVLVRAFQLVQRQEKDAKLVLVGPDEGAAADLMALSEKLGVKDHVIFTGKLNNPDLVSAYYACDVFALCSYVEAFGISLLEAQAAGKPCVASGLGGVPFVVKNGETGLLVPPGNVQAVAQALNLLLNDEGMRLKMGQEARKWAEEHEWSKIAKRILNLYTEILAEP